MPTRLAFVPQASRKKRSAAHKLFRPRNTSHAKRFTTAIKKIRAWQWLNAKLMKNKQRCFALSHSHLCRHASRYFFNCFRYAYCHALCTSDVALRSFSRASFTHFIPLTSQLVLARSLAAFIFCGGTAEAAKALLFVRALFLARLPRTPTRLARARMDLTVISVVVKFISYPREQKCSVLKSFLVHHIEADRKL